MENISVAGKKHANNNKWYFDFASLKICDNLIFFQFTEESFIHVYAAFHFALFALENTLERCIRHHSKQISKTQTFAVLGLLTL